MSHGAGVSRRPGTLPPVPVAPPRPIHLARDHPRQVVATRTRHAEWERLARGAYVDAASSLAPRARALAVIGAVDDRLAKPHWFSHESAALIWGLPVWRLPRLTHLRQGGRAGGERDRAVMRHSGLPGEDHLTSVGGLPVTDLEQTMVDCARSLRPLAGLVVADAALRAGADRGCVLEMLERLRGRNGAARALDVVMLADDGAESPGETATRFVLLRDGLPRPETQVRVETRLGAFWADVGWEEWRVLLEYDGRAKYRSMEDLIREKRRHDALVEAGVRPLRVTKEDIPGSSLSRRARALLPPGIPMVQRPLLRS